MPHFYFHILDGRSPADDLGLELANVDEAKSEALRLAGAVLNEDRPRDIWRGKVWEMRVTDSPSLQTGTLVLTLRLRGLCPISDA